MKMMKAYKSSKRRKEKREFNSIIELIEIFSRDYLEIYSAIDIMSPFGGSFITIGKFDNSGKRTLQLKLSSSGSTNENSAYPGTTSKGDAWMLYETWTHFLDQIDSINRDYLISSDLGFFSIKKIQNNDDFDKLIAKIDDITEHLEELKEDGKKDNAASKELKNLNHTLETVQQKGTLKKRLAKKLIDCLSWTPREKIINYKNIEDIPHILSKEIAKMCQELSLSSELQPEQARAADSLFFVVVCENFRIPGSLKYIRSCLRYLINNNLSFQEVFNKDITKTICTLSPAGGTKVTRECLEKGKLEKLTDDQKKPYDMLSDSSESEDEPKAVNVAYRKK